MNNSTITFAGIGAFTTAELATNQGWPVLVAVLAGGVVAMVIGLIVGVLSIRLGDLYVALVTLAFGLIVENLVFTLPQFVNSGLGLSINRPSFATTDRGFAYVCLAAFIIFALFILNFRRSTSGLAMNAVRWSDPGARTTGEQPGIAQLGETRRKHALRDSWNRPRNLRESRRTLEQDPDDDARPAFPEHREHRGQRVVAVNPGRPQLPFHVASHGTRGGDRG